MTVREKLLQEIDRTPDVLLGQILNILLLLKTKTTDKLESSSTQPNQELTPNQRISTGRTILENLDRIGRWEGDDCF